MESRIDLTGKTIEKMEDFTKVRWVGQVKLTFTDGTQVWIEGNDDGLNIWEVE